ncbi:MAG TPA: FixH family protein [Gemmatimonadaceae bacterium]
MKRGMMWPVAVATILGLTVAANIWVIRIANADPSFAVEENYYERGVHWDDEMAQRSRNRELGWTLDASLTPIEAGRGAALSIALRDSVVGPIENASVVVRALHVARANSPVEVTLSPTGAGHYEAMVPLERAGLWELRFEVQRGADRFTATERLDARAGQQ